MTWLRRYRVRHFLENSIWVAPAVAMVLALVAIRVLHWIEESMGWETTLNAETARTVLAGLAGAMFTFIVFVCSSLLLVVQLASAQLTPRVIGTMFRDPVTKFALAVFVFAFTFVLAALIRVGSSVPYLITQVAGYCSVVTIGMFLYLIDHVGKMLRPSGALASVAAEGHEVLDSVYPRRLTDKVEPIVEDTDQESAPGRALTSPRGGVVLAFDVEGLVALAARHDCLIEMVPQVGNLLGPGDAVLRVHGGADLPPEALLQSIALGTERTMEQDPTFAFRVIVDIASKGLSPAINDPTTAVLALDHIHHLLRHVGKRRLDNARVRDATGRVRLVYRTPDWEDFVTLAVTEIRQFGGTSIQVARRLRAMLENLIQTLPPERAAPLQQELKILKRTAERFFHEPEDRALADISDAQGVGGAQDRRRPLTQAMPGLTKVKNSDT
jgi:uncharacterized membrane protein